jgi:hypothetical protein
MNSGITTMDLRDMHVEIITVQRLINESIKGEGKVLFVRVYA